MKRKIIQQGNNTLTITLPRPWANEHALKAGMEVDVECLGPSMLVHAGQRKAVRTATLDVSSMDRTSLMLWIRGLYRQGVDDITVTWKDQTVMHYRTGKPVKVIAAIHLEVSRLIGAEILEEAEHSCRIRCIAGQPLDDLDAMLRKIYHQLRQVATDFGNGLKERQWDLLAATEEKHDTITKFTSYCLRLLNKQGAVGTAASLQYVSINAVDIIVDAYKYAARDLVEHKPKMSPKAAEMMLRICDFTQEFASTAFSEKSAHASELLRKRDIFLRDLRERGPKLTGSELLEVTRLSQVLQVMWELLGARLGMMDAIK